MNAVFRHTLSLLLLSTLGLGSLHASATQIDIQLPFDEFGKTSNSGDSCAATSMINSFRYLENHFPKVYGNKLTGKTASDLEQARDKLRDGYTAPNGEKRSGTGCPTSKFSFKQIWEAKVNYVEDFAPKTTSFSGMQKKDTITGKDLDTKGWLLGDKIDKNNPTFDYLYTNISAGADIEFAFIGGGFDHMMTLTSLHLDDKNDNKKFDQDQGEKAFIDYLDPENTSKLFKSEITIKDGFITFAYDNGTTKIPEAQIYLAYAESPIKPVPEPAEWLLLSLGGIVVMARKRFSRHTTTPGA